MVRLSSCLYRDKRSGTLYFRRSIPHRLRLYFNGMYEYKKALGTVDKSVALPRAMLLNAQLQQQFNDIERNEMSDKYVFEMIVIGEIDTLSGGAAPCPSAPTTDRPEIADLRA